MGSSKRIDEEHDEIHWIKPVYFPRAEASLSEMRSSLTRKKKRSLTGPVIVVHDTRVVRWTLAYVVWV